MDDCRVVTITVDAAQTVSGLLMVPLDAVACYILAHGAGAGMTHPFMTAVAHGLHDRRIASLRFQFPYMEKGSRRPDPPALAHATIRAAVAAATLLVPGVALIAGGKSFGGRMTAQAQAAAPLPAVRGLAFLGFPLHPAGKPSDDRGRPLFDVRIPMLFLQGNRDALADTQLLVPLVQRLCAALTLLPGADHSFHVPVRSGRTDAQVLGEALDRLTAWCQAVVSGGA